MSGVPEASTSSSATPASDAPASLISVKVFRPSSQSTLKATNDLPESYFAPTTHELAVAHTAQSKARERLTDAPMLTKRLRDEQTTKAFETKKQKYPKVRRTHVPQSDAARRPWLASWACV